MVSGSPGLCLSRFSVCTYIACQRCFECLEQQPIKRTLVQGNAPTMCSRTLITIDACQGNAPGGLSARADTRAVHAAPCKTAERTP